jgi:tRNA pseudouridine38-40 synthase
MRYALGIEYQGNGFYGWQTQQQSPTVQQCVEAALAKVANHPVTVTCAGRTDTGVHALGQTIHFDCAVERSERSWILGCNSHLEPGISALWIRPVDDDFSARFSAESRSYRFHILNRWVRPAVERELVCWVRPRLADDSMHEAACHLLGEHDFSAFRAAGCSANHAIREIKAISVERQGNYIDLDITANGFLYHMVRNIAGSLIDVGKGLHGPEWINELLISRNRNLAGVTAPSAGLYFLGPIYPPRYKLPAFPFNAFPRGEDQS